MSDFRVRLNKSDKAEISQLIRGGIAVSEVAVRLGKHECIVRGYLNSNEYKPHRKPRKCLCCGNVFMSEHAGNRLCGKHGGESFSSFEALPAVRL